LDDERLVLRGRVYDGFLSKGRSPTVPELAAGLGLNEAQVRAGLRHLAEERAVVLQPESGEVLMAHPFSAVPTPFVVTCEGRSWWGNCIWDGLGILAMLHADGEVRTGCPDCGEALCLSVRSGELGGGPAVAHFAVPARHWWADIVFT
jgi:hypothetical protein